MSQRCHTSKTGKKCQKYQKVKGVKVLLYTAITSVTPVTLVTPYIQNGEFMLEKDLVNDIRKYLQTKENLFFWKEHGGQFGTAGIPDIIVCYKGKFIAFECKKPGGKPTLLQSIAINKIKRAGGISQVVYSLDEVKAIIEEI